MKKKGLLKTKAEVKKHFPDGIEKLDVGSGTRPEPGYTHLDILPNLPDLDILGTALKMPIPDNFVSELRAVHIMEHFCHPEFSGVSMRKKYGTTTQVLKEFYRVLKPGGKLRIVTPDFDKLAKSVATKRVPYDYLQQWTVGGHHDEYDVHHWLWTKTDAEQWFSEVGFTDLNDWNPVQSFKKVMTLKWKTTNRQSQAWYDIEWYHWLFFEGTK